MAHVSLFLCINNTMIMGNSLSYEIKTFTETSFDSDDLHYSQYRQNTIRDVCQGTLVCWLVLWVLEGYYF